MTLYIRVDDGIVKFASHIIHATINDDAWRKIPYQIEQDGIVVYSDIELQSAEAKLKELNITYTVEQLTPDQMHVAKTQGMKYASRSEAIGHILNNEEPESQKIPNINKNIKMLGQQSVANDLLKLDLKQQNEVLGKQLVNLELKFLSMGGKL